MADDSPAPSPDGPVARAASRSARTPRAEVRLRLLAAAAQVFAAQGVHEARLDDVAATAGFSKGAVYSNFASKEDLVAQVMQVATSRVLDSVQELVRPEVAAADLGDVVRAAFGRHEQIEQFALLSEFRGFSMRHPELMPEFQRQRRALQDGVASVVQQWFGAHPEVDPGLPLDVFGIALVAMNVGIAFDAPVLPGVEPGEVIAQVVEAVVRR